MTLRVRLLSCLLLLICLGFFAQNSAAQNFNGEPVKTAPHPSLDKELTAYEVWRVDVAGLNAYVKKDNGTYGKPFQLQIGQHNWKIELTPSGIMGPDYTLQVLTPHGLEITKPKETIAFKGYDLNSGGAVRLTIEKDFLSGFVMEGKKKWYIEPLWYHEPTVSHDLFVVYDRDHVIPNSQVTCGADELEENLKILKQQKKNEAVQNGKADFNATVQLDYAIACDNSMVTKYGSVSAVQSRNAAVVNDVEGNYVGNFNNDLCINIITQFIVTGSDPWTASTNSNTLLTSFQNWGNSGGFGVTFDDAGLWSNRDFDGSVIGLAFLNGICNSVKYHVLQDFTSNSEFIRVLNAHEMGHNFSMTHDPSGSPFIMAPVVSASTTWSSNSQSQFNGYTQPLINNGCLAPCGPPPPPLVADFSWSPNPGCVSQPVQFTDQSTGAITGRSWTFQGGTPATSTQTNPTVTWATAGTKNITLTLSGVGGPVSKTKQITINPKPTASFTSSVNGLTVTFTNSSTNATSFSWDFGDGGTSTDVNPVYTYLASGIYTVVLTATNDCGSVTKTLIVNTAPTADFTATPTAGCTQLSVSFQNQSSSNAVSYLWTFPGGTPANSTQANPTVLYFNSGSYSVTLKATNSAGSSTVTKTNYITPVNPPVAIFNYTINGLTVSFSNNSAGATSYLWNFGDNTTSTLAAPTHTYTAAGTYTVTLTASNAYCSTTATKTFTLSGAPTAAFTATPTSGCGPLTVVFNNSTTGSASQYSWEFPGGTPSSSTVQNPTVVYNTPGNYSVTLTASNGAGSSTATQQNYIHVFSAPTASFTSTTNGLTANFTNTSNSGGMTTPGAITYLWDFGDNTTSAVENPTHTYAADGTYTVTLTTTNSCGSHTATATVVIVTPPTANFTATPTSGCAPLTVQFQSTSSTNAASYSWQFPGGNPATSTAQNPTVVYAMPGTYSVTLTVGNAAGTNSASQSNYITVNTTPTAGFTSTVNGTTASFTNTSVNATSYSWDFGDNSTSTAVNPTHTYSGDGTYTVILSATNPCGTVTSASTVVVVTPPTASFTATPTNGCGPLTVQFQSTSSTNAVSYNWQFPGGNPASSTVQNPTVVYATPGTYSVTLTVGNAAGSNTASQSSYIVVAPPPTAGFTSSTNGATVAFTNTSQNATSYAWAFGDGNNSNAAEPTHTYLVGGTYTVTLTATNACGTNTSVSSVTVTTAPTAGFNAPVTSGCAPLTVTFNNTSTSNATSFQWEFPGGTPSTSTLQNPTVTYNAPGLYTVILTASNSAGSNTATLTNYITVGTVPVPDFTSSVSGATATFTNGTTGATSYTWDFDDGSGSVSANPSHTYQNDGTYTVVLTATNACGTATYTQDVVIITSPNAGFTAQTTSGCPTLTVQFQDLSTTNTTSWAWSFPGGDPATSTAQNPVVNYSTSGVYDVTLVASGPGGSSTFTQTGFINVLPQPIPGFDTNVNGATVVFTNNSVNATTYFWDFGDNSSSAAQDPTHTYTADGVYTVVMSAINNCGTFTATQVLTIITPPTAQYSQTPGTGCAPLTVAFTNQSSTNATTFLWDFPGGNPATSTQPNPSASWSQPGTYTITLTASNSAGASTSTSTITVGTTPSASFTSVGAGLSIVFTNTSVNATSYLWNFGDNSTSTETNPTHPYALPGEYTVTLKATNDCGTVEITQVVVVQGTPPISQFTAGEQAGCVPLTVSFTDQSAGTPTEWLWNFPGGSPSSSVLQNPTVTYAVPGTYDVSLQVTNPYGTNSTTQVNYITVQAFPSTGFTYTTASGTVTFNNTSTNAIAYSWNFGDNSSSSTETNPVHTYTASGTYTVELTAVNNCGASTLQKQVVVVIVGVSEASWLDQFRLFPNPNTGQFAIEMRGPAQDEVEFTLFNSVGQLIRRDAADFGSGALTRAFDYGQLPSGVYALRVTGRNAETNTNATMYVKVVIEN